LAMVYATRTSQFVAVNGTRENIQPSREALSEASRTYLSVRMMVSPPKSHHRLCMSESRYGYACQYGCVVLTIVVYICNRRRLTGSRLCVRNYVSVSMCSRMSHCDQLTEMALMLGSSCRPPDRARAPLKLPASRHKPVHDRANTMAAQCVFSASTSYSQAPHQQRQAVAERMEED
jgi:hypothetical protein